MLIVTGLLIEAVVVVVKDGLLGNKLIALGTTVNERIGGKKIIGSCAEMLPPHMVPADMILLRSLPKNKNGKVFFFVFCFSRMFGY